MTVDIYTTTNASPIRPPKLISTLVTTLFQEIEQNLNSAADSNDYNKTINYTTLGVDQLLPQLLTIFLDARSHAYSMQGQPDSAIADAHRMIGHTSTPVDGHLRKANVFIMYGRQLQAIEACDEGLQNIVSGKKLQSDVQKLQKEREMAIKYNEKRIDFIHELPIEIVNDVILPLLSHSAKTACLTVSKSWRNIVIDCSRVWETLSVDGNDEETIGNFSLVPYIGRHVKDLRLNTQIGVVHEAFFYFTRSGYFTKIESVKFTEIPMEYRRQGSLIARMTVALWQTRKTLTTLDLDLSDNVNAVNLADVLMLCTNLVKLSFSTTHALSKLVGDFSTMEQHTALIDLQIKAKKVIGQDIGSMLQRCQQLRRFIMHTCSESVFDVISRYTPNLEVLGYNSYFITQPLQKSGDHKTKGLKSLYTNNYFPTISIKSILPLIYKNKATLVELHAAISEVTEIVLQEVYSTYPDFTLDKINKLTLWMYNGTQQFMLRSIHDSTTLTDLTAAKVHDVNGLVNTLMNLSPLSTLEISYVFDTAGRSSLIHLFERYARVAEKSQSSLTYARFGHCDAISDDVLSSLASINTLHKICLCDLRYVSTNGINNMISKLSSQLSYLRLELMKSVTDDVIFRLGDLKKLNCIVLVELGNVTDASIYELFDKADTHILTNLVVRSCPMITAECIEYTKQKVTVEHT